MRKIPKSKGKGKRWPKGQSSNSNPETRKYRSAARSRFFHHDTGTSSALTAGALKTLDAFTSRGSIKKESVKNEALDTESSAGSWDSSKTFKTFASDWSDCSNASFSKLFTSFQPGSFLHKEMLAVLAAVAEVIKANGGKETSTEYFGALMTTLEISDSEDSVAAILSLLAMGIKSVPQEILRLKFSEATRVFLDLLVRFSDVENGVILRSAIGCLSVLLRAQDLGVWANSSTLQVFQSILVFVTYTKPKVRKAAQHAVCAILKASAFISEEETHPAAPSAAKYCIQQIEKGVVMSGNTTTLHILTLLKEIIASFPKSYIKSTCETIMKLMTLGNALVTSCSFEVLHGLFVSTPPKSRLHPSLNAQILNALYDYQPSSNDCQPTLAWLTVMQEAHRALARNDPQLCVANMTKFFMTGTKLWLSENNEIVKGATLSLRAVATECIKACSDCREYLQLCQMVFTVVERGLTYQYHNAWLHVLNLLGVLFEAIGADGEGFMMPCLKTLADLRDSYNFTYARELEFTIGKAIRSLGPEVVLKAIPLTITEKEPIHELKRTWLLPVLKDNIQSSKLLYFIQQFLPMASLCEKRSKELASSNDKVGAHSYDLLQIQIWSLLPAFCSNANDVAKCFKEIAKTLGVLIHRRKNLRLPIMTALRKLITRGQECQNEESLNALRYYAKNFIPILLNLYTTKAHGSDEEGERLAALETIKVYLSISNTELCSELFDKAFKRLEESGEDQFTKESVMDIVKLLLPYQDEDRINRIYMKCLATIKEAKCRKDEKKSYRLLEQLCSSESENCKNFVKKRQKEIQSFLLKSLRRTKVPNRGARLRCLLCLVRILTKNQYNVIKSVIPEAVICCKDVNQKTRTCAFLLLEEMFFTCQRWTTKSKEDIIRDYIGLLLGGLAGAPTLASATLLALTKLSHTLKCDLPEDVLQLLLDNVCLLSSSATREIVGACLGYIKLVVASFPKDIVLPHIPLIVKAIVSMTEDCKRHFRLKTRDVLDRLLRKFGYETIQPLVPSSDVIMQKRLKNLKRINAKKKLAKTAAADSAEDDEIEEFASKAKPKSIEEILASSDESDDEGKIDKKQKNSEMYIEEDSENIVDFISPSATKRMSATKPSKKEAKKDNAIKTAADGRLMVIDEEDGDEDAESKASDVDDVTSTMSQVVIGKKRKLSVSSGPPAKYQAGGSGIHRPVGNAAKLLKKRKDKHSSDSSELKTGKEYRAKKAKGDVKLKGRPDPYAYIPLSRKLLNRRKKLKNSGRFRNIIKSAVKGARIGAKAKMSRRR